jgi:hypothetical protein
MMGFNDIIGQRVIVESLRNAVKSNMISNGYVLVDLRLWQEAYGLYFCNGFELQR